MSFNFNYTSTCKKCDVKYDTKGYYMDGNCPKCAYFNYYDDDGNKKSVKFLMDIDDAHLVISHLYRSLPFSRFADSELFFKHVRYDVQDVWMKALSFVECIFDPSDASRASCDSIYGINQYLKRGVEGFNDLINDRYNYCKRNSGVELSAWVIKGAWVLDKFAQVLKLNEGCAANAKMDFHDVIPYDAYASHINHFSMSFIGKIPKHTDECALCKKNFTLDELHEIISIEQYETNKFFHKYCRHIACANDSLNDFGQCFTDAGYENFKMSLTANGYCRCNLCKPWVNVKFTVGNSEKSFTVGWRKRVIEITVNGDEKIDLSKLFSSEDVTKNVNYIHAWSSSDAVKYLATIREYFESNV